MKRIFMLAAAAVLLSWAGSHAADLKPTRSDKCPVCGMFVYKYPDWTTSITMADGKVFWFDGPKDLFKFVRSVGTYAPGKTETDISEVSVKEYYGLKPIDGRKAFYVIGSDVLGPMGRELIPFLSEKDAREFMSDHKGKQILRFEDVTPEILKGLDY
jgi:copper chaperone NosL